MSKYRNNPRIRNLLLLLLLINLVSLPCRVNADTGSEQTVRVGYYQRTDFQEGSSDETPKSGYGYEYLQQVAAYTGWNYEYVYGDWEELYQELTDGEIDSSPGGA